MRLRLQVTAGEQPAYPFDHSGPVIRIGRDPAFQGVNLET